MEKEASYMHGDDVWRYKNRVVANFSTNVWYKGVSASLLTYLNSCFNDIQNYPTPQTEELTNKIKTWLTLTKSSVLVCNGSTEGIYLLAQLFQNRVSRIFSPTFAEYERACSIFNHTIHHHRWDVLNEIPSGDESIWWICNPVNPTGKVFCIDTVVQLLEKHPKAIFVIDEAYQMLAENFISAQSLTNGFGNLIVLRSLTKCLAIPGLRVGCLIGQENLLDQINQIRQPWSVNTLAFKAVEFACENLIIKPEELDEFFLLKHHLLSEIDKMPGFEIQPSSTGYFLVKTPLNAARLKNQLIDNYGILVRNASNFRYLGSNTIRVATQSECENKLLVDALMQISQLS